jgi:hypothetical protein
MKTILSTILSLALVGCATQGVARTEDECADAFASVGAAAKVGTPLALECGRGDQTSCMALAVLMDYAEMPKKSAMANDCLERKLIRQDSMVVLISLSYLPDFAKALSTMGLDDPQTKR